MNKKIIKIHQFLSKHIYDRRLVRIGESHISECECGMLCWEDPNGNKGVLLPGWDQHIREHITYNPDRFCFYGNNRDIVYRKIREFAALNRSGIRDWSLS
jgi:hypothetical protein